MGKAAPAYPNGSEFLKRAAQVASSYGFAPLSALVKNRPRESVSERLENAGDAFANELAGAVRAAVEYRLHADAPTLFYRSGGRQRRVLFGLHVVGTAKSIGEAIVLRTAATILEEAGLPATVSLNAVGDRDSAARFAREVAQYLRRHANDLPAPAREAMKEDPFRAYEYLHRKAHPLRENAPRGMEFLSEASRRHLKEVLEYLEAVGVPYEIDDGLVGSRDVYSEILFEVRGGSEGTVIARGGRCDELPRRAFRAAMPGVGIVFACERDCDRVDELLDVRPRHPKVFFIQLGFDAKLRSLAVLEVLRRARIPVEQAICRDKLSGQLAEAEVRAVPYVIIMGQKEVLEGTVIVRHMETRSQNVVPVDLLPSYLKEIVR